LTVQIIEENVQEVVEEPAKEEQLAEVEELAIEKSEVEEPLTEVTKVEEPAPPPQLDMSKIDQNVFAASLDASLSDLENHDKIFNTSPVTVTLGLGSMVTAGYVAWVLRSGALLSALLSSMPAWGRFDPIVVLASRDAKKKDKSETENPLSKAERMFEKAG